MQYADGASERLEKQLETRNSKKIQCVYFKSVVFYEPFICDK